ncbi:MAG: hypothetical protein ACRCTY_00270, partial [Candidatus Adiutrix sp.]
DPTKVDEALAGFNEIIAKVRQNEISAEELEGAKRYISGITKIRLQTVASRAGQTLFNTLYGLGLDYETQRLAAIEKITAQEVMKAAFKYLNPNHSVLAQLGPKQSDKQAGDGATNLDKPSVNK